MALRTFSDREGRRWNAWHVIPNGTLLGYPVRYRGGWVCFEMEGGGGRCRIPLAEMPDDWASLPDERLDLMRKMGEAAPGTGTMAKVAEDTGKLSVDAKRSD